MATHAAVVVRRAEVEKRLEALADKLSASIDAPPPPQYVKDPEIRAIQKLEYLVSLLEATSSLAEDAALAQAEATRLAEVLDGDTEDQPKAPAPKAKG